MSTEQQPTGPTYALYASFAADPPLPAAAPRGELAAQAQAALSSTPARLRGAYTVTGYRADADMLLWLVGHAADDVQDALLAFRHSDLGRLLRPAWSAIGVHREAEFNRSHVPAFFAGEAPREWLCAYPFVRTPEWYLLEPERRRALLVEHGLMGREYPDVRANTVSAFGLGDYEWLLAFEADDLGRIVDLIRHLRAAEARLYTKNELPFITGLRKPLVDILAELP